MAGGFFPSGRMPTFGPMTHTVDFGGEDLVLHPWGALFWARKSVLVLSDVHLGKITHFRKYGAAVPHAALLRNFERLRGLESEFQPERICFLGDLFHSHMNREWALFEAWANGCGAALELVVGNHDIISPLQFEKLGIRLSPSLQKGPFCLTHHPLENFEGYNMAGHVHPAVRLRGPGRQQLRLPCFYLRGKQLILPAFGAFTGSHVLEPADGDRVYALAEDQIIPLQEPAHG